MCGDTFYANLLHSGGYIFCHINVATFYVNLLHSSQNCNSYKSPLAQCASDVRGGKLNFIFVAQSDFQNSPTSQYQPGKRCCRPRYLAVDLTLQVIVIIKIVMSLVIHTVIPTSFYCIFCELVTFISCNQSHRNGFFHRHR